MAVDVASLVCLRHQDAKVESRTQDRADGAGCGSGAERTAAGIIDRALLPVRPAEGTDRAGE